LCSGKRVTEKKKLCPKIKVWLKKGKRKRKAVTGISCGVGNG